MTPITSKVDFISCIFSLETHCVRLLDNHNAGFRPIPFALIFWLGVACVFCAEYRMACKG